MSPVTKRRIQAFKSNKRAIWSLRIFMLLFIVSLFAEVIANDRPVVVKYNGVLYYPFLKSYPETTFGGYFGTEPDYAETYVKELINKKGWIAWPAIKYRYDSTNYDLTQPAPCPPNLKNWLGTDDQGRDVFARLIYGFRVSVLFGLCLTITSSALGIAAGAIQGYFGGLADLAGQRFMEIWGGMPVLFLLIILSSFVEPNYGWLLAITLAFGWMALVGPIRAEFLKGRNLDYVKAARSLGITSTSIIFRHILPNALVATLTFLPFLLTGAITTLTSLDFLGFGLPPGSASLGELLAQGKANLHAPWLGISAFVTLAAMLSMLVFIGEGLRDAMDPRHFSQRGQ
ncbi:ABC transporter permease [Desulforegula conservatrix]|nr:ABC transporter permease [Desulforegula conservatrix]